MAFVVDDILLAPIKFTKWIAENCREVGERVLTDEGAVEEQILALQIRYEMGEITEEEYQELEEPLMEELEAIRKYKEEKEERERREPTRGRRWVRGRRRKPEED